MVDRAVKERMLEEVLKSRTFARSEQLQAFLRYICELEIAGSGLTTYLGQSPNVYPVNRVQPYAQRWSFNFQRELPLGILLDTSYVGNHAVRIQVNRELNPTNPAYLSTSPVRDAATISF